MSPYRSDPAKRVPGGVITRDKLKQFYRDFKGYVCRRCGAVFDAKQARWKHRTKYCEPKPEEPQKPPQLELDL